VTLLCTGHTQNKDGCFNIATIRAGVLPRRGGECSLYLSGVKKVVLVPLRVLSLNRSTAGAFAVPFTVLS